VYQVTSSQNASRPDERRRNPRHRASSIIYVQIGSENGGIVIDIGIDGVACQAARKLTAEGYSNLNLRLHGSGLDVDLVGDLVWLGATRKEVGFCFKSPSTKAQQGIADWIERQTQGCGTAPLEDRSRPKPVPAMPGIFAAEEKSIPPSLPAALAMSQAISVDPPSSAGADANEACLPASLAAATGIPGPTPLPEIASPIQQSNIPAHELDDRLDGGKVDLFASPEQPLLEQPLHDQPLPELSPVERPSQSPADQSSTIVFTQEPMPPARKDLPPASVESQGEPEFFKTKEREPISRDGISRPPDSLRAATVAEKWAPPALLAAWRRGNRQQKFLLAGTASACLLIFILALTLAVTHIGSSSGRSAGSGSAQQSAPPPATPSVSVVSSQTGPVYAAPPPRATPPPEPDPEQPPPSLLARLAETFLGSEPEKPEPTTEIEIDQKHVGVQVWTSKSSGYYYCTDSSYYQTVQPGAFMTQRDALQSGYQPKLGRFCN
jgi:hypothetical protein